jgi:NAD-dependent deacetylase sirtuin 2
MRITPVDLAGLARLILSPECQSIGILTGAGVSVASGIPDFRSPGGMYETLRPALITASKAERALMSQDPTYVVSWNIFRNNQFPYLEVRRPFILGTREETWKATIAHRFAELLHTKTHKLTRVFTQNIDGIDRQCKNIPPERIVSVHGSIAEVCCENCNHQADFDEFCDAVQSNIKDIYKLDPQAPETSTHILCTKCQLPLVKPRTVLFGRSLPSEFFERIQDDLPTMDLLIVAGTSLMVSPANSVVYSVPDTTVRVVVNREPVGAELGIDYSAKPKRDFFLEGNCDAVFLELIQHLGWLDDLAAIVDVLPASSARLVRQATEEAT